MGQVLSVVIQLVASSRRRISVDFEITFDGATLHPAQKVKVLGVVLDENLTFEDHISVVIRRCYTDRKNDTHLGSFKIGQKIASFPGSR